jgi:hypothetical protein
MLKAELDFFIDVYRYFGGTGSLLVQKYVYGSSTPNLESRELHSYSYSVSLVSCWDCSSVTERLADTNFGNSCNWRVIWYWS